MEIAGNQLKPESIDIQSRPKALLRVRCRWKSNGIKRFACGPRYVVRKENSNSNSIPVLSFRPPTPYKIAKYCGISHSSTLYTTPWHEFLLDYNFPIPGFDDCVVTATNLPLSHAVSSPLNVNVPYRKIRFSFSTRK